MLNTGRIRTDVARRQIFRRQLIEGDMSADLPNLMTSWTLDKIHEIPVHVACIFAAIAMDVGADVCAFPLNPDMGPARKLGRFDIEMRRRMLEHEASP